MVAADRRKSLPERRNQACSARPSRRRRRILAESLALLQLYAHLLGSQVIGTA